LNGGWEGGHGRAGSGEIKEGDPSVVLLLDHDLKGLANETIKVTGGPSYERFAHCMPLHQRRRAQSTLFQHVPRKVTLPFLTYIRGPEWEQGSSAHGHAASGIKLL
jgi:hypothetical protein